MQALANRRQVECRVVLYHYVRDLESSEYPRIKGLDIEGFRRQLDYLNDHYNIVSLDEYLNYEGDQTKRLCMLTFDDGFKDHFVNVMPLLRERGLAATFYPVTQPLVEESVLAIHKTHFLLAKLGAGEFANAVNSFLPQPLRDQYWVDGRAKLEVRYRWDDNLTANLKSTIAMLPDAIKTDLLSTLFNEYFDDEAAFSRALYMNFGELREMEAAGMTIGCHTHTHPRLSQLTEENQREEIRISRQCLAEGLGHSIETFSYPNGDYDRTTIELLREQNFSSAMTTTTGVNPGIASTPFEILRIDTNDINSREPYPK